MPARRKPVRSPRESDGVPRQVESKTWRYEFLIEHGHGVMDRMPPMVGAETLFRGFRGDKRDLARGHHPIDSHIPLAGALIDDISSKPRETFREPIESISQNFNNGIMSRDISDGGGATKLGVQPLYESLLTQHIELVVHRHCEFKIVSGW